MIESFANWMLNTFVRLSPEMLKIIIPIVVLLMFISLAKGLKQTSAKDNAKLKNVAFGPLILSFGCFAYLSIITILG